MCRFALVVTLGIGLLLGFAPPAAAQGGPSGDGIPPEFAQVEEEMLRQQIEIFLNEGARWDAERGRIVFKQGARELGPLEGPVAGILGQICVPDENGRLKIREGVKLRPFAEVIRDYLAEGGFEDIERFRRMRDEGRLDENPFRDGIPPRVMKAVQGIMKALSEQNLRPFGQDGARGRDRAGRAGGGQVEGGRGRSDGERAEARRRGDGERRAEARSRERGPGGFIRDEVARRLDIDPEELEMRLRIARDLARQAERDIARIREDLERRLDELGVKDEIRSFGRRAGDRFRRLVESDAFRERMADAERRVMDFLASEEGRRLERRALEFFESERGQALQRRLDEYLRSKEGRENVRRALELWARLRGGPDRPERRTEDRTRERRSGATRLF